MVLRPHMMRYRNKFKKIDSEKMAKVKSSFFSKADEYNSKHVLPKYNTFLYTCGGVVVLGPLVYVQMLIRKSEKSKKTVTARK